MCQTYLSVRDTSMWKTKFFLLQGLYTVADRNSNLQIEVYVIFFEVMKSSMKERTKDIQDDKKQVA